MTSSAGAGPEPAPQAPLHRVASILRDHANTLHLSAVQARAVRDITSCRTEQLGGHLQVCNTCGFSRGSYNSCRNRHCPTCQRLKQQLWAEAQEAVLLPVLYFQIVFTIPTELHGFFRRAPAVCLALLFDVVAQTLTEVAQLKIHATIGFTAVLHTWTQQLDYHPHIHILVPAGGLTPDRERWVATSRRFFLPIKKLRLAFRAKLLASIEAALRAGEIPGRHLASDLGQLRHTPKVWNVFAKAPLAGPQHVVRYLSRYVHRIAITDARITSYDGQTVTFRYIDRRAGVADKRTLPGRDFARLFLQHVLPRRFVRIRHYGLFAARCRHDLARCRQILGAQPAQPPPKDADWVAACRRLLGIDPLQCPACKVGVLVVHQTLTPLRS